MNLALFDFDGTITTREMYGDFMRFAVEPGRLAIGNVVLAPVIAGYKLGMVSGNTTRSIVANFVLRGVEEAKVRQAGRQFASDVLPAVLRPMALERIQWHKEQGDVVVVVSGGLDLYLAPWCDQHDLGLICSTLEVSAGVLTGRYRGQQCVGQEKSRRVLEAYDIGDFPVVYAYGDTADDLDMLDIAHRKYFRWQEVA